MNKEIIRAAALPILTALLAAPLAAPPAFAQSLKDGGYMATGPLIPFWVNTSSPTPVNIMNLRATPTPNVSINGSVGIGTTTPQVSLDVNGGVRPGSSATVTTCGSGAANGEGTQRYNYGTHGYEYCNGTKWQGFGGSGFPVSHGVVSASVSGNDENGTWIATWCYAQTDSNGLPLIYQCTQGTGCWGWGYSTFNQQVFWSGKGKSSYSWYFACSVTSAGLSAAGPNNWSAFAPW
ncbi:MAG: hypothetical protein P4M13_01405 [Alphaproteobacteria bacterium]|nr:hypothetical protein [Alphaproteobacteria bacterium]